MKSKISDKNKICSNCKNLIISGQRFFYEQLGKNYNVFCLTCFFEKSMNQIIDISKNLKSQLRD